MRSTPERGKGAHRGRVAALLGRLPRAELLLSAGLLLCLLLPLLLPLALPAASSEQIELPGIEEPEGVLLQYLIPEELQGGGSAVQDVQSVPSLQTRTYAVAPGDTVSGIAQRFGLSMDTVISFNGIKDARALATGTELQIPNHSGLKYVVRRGDNLESIARRYGIALNDLLDWNGLESALIVPGQRLFIPGARLSEMELNRVFGRLFLYPTAGRITSYFGNRKDPFTGIQRFHNGVDIANSQGTPVTAAMSGRVTLLGFNANYGRFIILTHPEDFQTLYGHLDSFSVARGQTVKQGQLIGKMGNTGYSTGTHLHFSIFRRGEPIDPLRYLH
jgi:murein DD-endopeptidase MepM/ murein hydrolase activator NlpD